MATCGEQTKCDGVHTSDNKNSVVTPVQLRRAGSPALSTKTQVGIWTVWDSLDSLGQFRTDFYSYTKF